MRTTIMASSISLVILGVILVIEAFRSPLTFYSMFDFGVFTLIAGICLPFATEVEKIVEAEWKTGSPTIPGPIMAKQQQVSAKDN
ncbi:MAG: hypothetical protein QW514_07480 [Thermoprotei archaeon]